MPIALCVSSIYPRPLDGNLASLAAPAEGVNQYVFRMIRRIRVSNFKSAKGTSTLELGRLTFLTGANSSGKSTIIQSILVLAQTAMSRADDRRLILNGPLARLGRFDDVVSHDATGRTIGLGIDLDLGGSLMSPALARRARLLALRHFGNRAQNEISISLDVTFSTPRRAPKASEGAKERRIRLDTSSVQMFHERRPEDFPRYSITLKRSASTAKTKATRLKLRSLLSTQRDLQGLETDVSFDQVSRARLLEGQRAEFGPIRSVIGAQLSHFLPTLVLLKVDNRDRLADELEIQLQPDSAGWFLTSDSEEQSLPREFLTILQELANTIDAELTLDWGHSDDPSVTLEVWRNWVASLGDSDQLVIRRRVAGWREVLLTASLGTDQPIFDLAPSVLPEPLREGVSLLDTSLRIGIQYVGPLRSAPSPNHPLTTSEELSRVGTQGQNTAAVLYNFKDTEVASNRPRVGALPARLEDEVGNWLEYLGLGVGVNTRDLGNMGHELKILDANGAAHDLTQLGVGVSQVLPILVAGLLAKRGETLLLEQPELHLNPRVQTRLTDFLIWLSDQGVQCIVETHSEHMINRLRRRRAEEETHSRREGPALYFVETDEGSSRYTRIEISEFGGVSSWPRGFFDESSEESRAILKAAATKRRDLEKSNE